MLVVARTDTSVVSGFSTVEDARKGVKAGTAVPGLLARSFIAIRRYTVGLSLELHRQLEKSLERRLEYDDTGAVPNSEAGMAGVANREHISFEKHTMEPLRPEYTD